MFHFSSIFSLSRTVTLVDQTSLIDGQERGEVFSLWSLLLYSIRECIISFHGRKREKWEGGRSQHVPLMM